MQIFVFERPEERIRESGRKLKQFPFQYAEFQFKNLVVE
jgi:hypothetical protein